ncbi:DNA-binding protein RFX5 isoform X2 [Gouania willdenowi]|uniref:DNA-binding protein RFX5 isoform X2 n=1 Tax=Gouania willdenowi TaxID=441366 RepID=UPI0010567E33|nr:DNA-binding protein RFX5 isoform X2 [Gouania willdenowi]
MSEEQVRVRPEGGAVVVGGSSTEPSLLLTILRGNISKSVQAKVEQILDDVQRFSDNDKLYLYLQLPSGPATPADKSVTDSASFNMSEQLHTCNWIRSHLEEHYDTCLPKQDVYETYRRHCEDLQHRPLSAANFGKIIRDIFPNIKARRLGGRGQSKYCYSGIRRKTGLKMPLLPNLDLKNDPAELTDLVQTYKQEVTEAACGLICHWAQKILKRPFDTVVEIAHYLIHEHIVNPRCTQAELVTSLAGSPAKTKVIKKTSVISKLDSDEAADTKKEVVESSSSLKTCGDKPAASKPSPSDAPPPSSSLRPAVEAFIKQLPRILPRSSLPDKTLTMRSSPPSLAPKDTSCVGAPVGAAGGGVKVIAMATLPSQQSGGPVPVMILPQGCLSYDKKAPPPTHVQPTHTSVLQTVRGGATARRPMEGGVSGIASAASSSTPPVKRKRGRPRKPRPEDLVAPPPHLPIITSVSGGVIQKASSSSVLELVIQEPPALVSERPGRPVLLLQGAVRPGAVRPAWELSANRTPMVEVIQKAPRPISSAISSPGPAHKAPPPPAEDRGHVITLSSPPFPTATPPP